MITATSAGLFVLALITGMAAYYLIQKKNGGHGANQTEKEHDSVRHSIKTTPIASDNLIRSPIAGTFYHSQSPHEPPTINISNQVKKGDTLCIIEAMKMMNQVTAEQDYQIISRLVQDGEQVEFDQPLFKVKPSITNAQ